MAATEKAKVKARLKRKVNTLSKKGNDPAFHEQIHYAGYEIAIKFYDSVKDDLEEYRSLVGVEDKDYLEISEAIAYLGSGILRGATARTRTLISAGDFSNNRQIYESEKHKVEKCYHLIRVFSGMEMRDTAVIATVKEVRDIIYELHVRLNRKSGCYVATVVYGNPNSQEVKMFKKYRDSVLKKSYLGNILVVIYYLISPTISKHLQNSSGINNFIRNKILNPFYRHLSSRI